MLRISTVVRISLSLMFTSISLLVLAHAIGLMPDAAQTEHQSRRSICEVVALQTCLAAEKNDFASLQWLAQTLVKRNPDVMRLAVKDRDGVERVSSMKPDKPVDDNFVATVPILRGKQEWGVVEIEFRFSKIDRIVSRFGNLMLPLMICFGGAVLLTNIWLLRRTLTHLDPSSVVPPRVQNTLDTLTEGVVLLDRQERIVMANAAFAEFVGSDCETLLSRRISDMPWQFETDEENPNPEFPWRLAIANQASSTGVILRLTDARGVERVFSANAAPIVASSKAQRGVVVTFDDLTSLEEKNVALSKLLTVLEKSREEIRVQNEELQFLATRDPLTACLNRRSFFSRVDQIWAKPADQRPPLTCLMVDIDHFKSINDNYGHAMGDKVLQHVSQILRSSFREKDLVCRYGGEEFCILILDVDVEMALQMAEHVRRSLESTPCDHLKITSSLGLAPISHETKTIQEAMERADKSLYVSKRSGRNRVTTWQQLVDRGETDLKPEDTKTRSRENEVKKSDTPPISLTAVQALFAILKQRESSTAEHSRRVADLCMVVGHGLLSEHDCYILEAAALLHDIGKLGVPDSILLKPGPLNETEWRLMDAHSELGVMMAGLVVDCPEIREIIRTHHAWYGGNPRMPDLPTGERIPLPARILALADAYDSIVSDRVYRRGVSRREAIKELRRCAGTQFDPTLVEQFIAVIGDTSNRRTTDFSIDQIVAANMQTKLDSAAVATAAAPSGVNAATEAIVTNEAQADEQPYWNLLESVNAVLEMSRAKHADNATPPAANQQTAKLSGD